MDDVRQRGALKACVFYVLYAFLGRCCSDATR